MDLRQMTMQAMLGRIAPNPMMQQIMQMRQQGLSPQQAMQKMAQNYPQFQKFQNPQQINTILNQAMQSVGVNPNDMMAAVKRFL